MKPRPVPPPSVQKIDGAEWPWFWSQMVLDSESETTYLLRSEELDWVRKNEEVIFRDSIRLEPIEKGLRVEDLSARSIFRYRGWQRGDLIREVNGIPVRSVEQLRKACDDVRSGHRNNLRVLLDRAGKSLAYNYRLAPPPAVVPPTVLPRHRTIQDYQCAAYEADYHEELFGTSLLSGGDQPYWSIAREEIDWILLNLDKVLGEMKAVPVPSKGLRIESLNEVSVLAARGLQEGDVLRKFNGATIESLEALRAAIGSFQAAPGDGLRIELEREGRLVRVFYRPGGRGSFWRINALFPEELHRVIQIGYLGGVRRRLDPTVKSNSSYLTLNPEFLRTAVMARRKDVLLYLLDKGARVNDGRPHTPILTAAALKPPDPGVVKLLLDRGADVAVADAEERTPVALAVREDALETVKLLLDKGAEVDPRDQAGRTPLMTAVARRNAAMVELLISRKANAKAVTPQGESIAAQAIAVGSFPLLKAVVEGGGTVEGFPHPDLYVRAAAAGAGSVEMLSFLKERKIIGADQIPGLAPLEAAIRSGKVDAVRWVLEDGVDGRRQGYLALLVPLVWEGRSNGTEIARLLVDDLLKKGGTLDDPDRSGATAALIYREQGLKAFADYLVEKGAPDLRNAGKGDPALNRKLIQAVKTGTPRAVQEALDEGADPEACDVNGESAMILAAERGRTDVLELLLEKGAKVGTRGPYGVSPLFRAADYGHARAVNLLLKKGADATVRGRGQTILDRVRNRGYPWVEYLLRQAGTVETPNRPGPATKVYATEEEARRSQELLQAIERKNATDVVSALAMGADPAARGNQGAPALIWAVETGRFDIVAALVSKGAPLDLPNQSGKTPAMRAVERRFIEIAEYLVMKGADVDLQDDRSETVLMKLIEAEQVELALTAIEKSKSVNAKNSAGWMALHLAASRGALDVVRLLVDRGGDVKAKAAEGATALSLAAKAGHAEVVEHLADRGANVNEPSNEYGNSRDWTPLMRASAAGHEAVVEVLLRKKAMVLYRNAQGQSALSVAREHQRDAIVERLQKAGAR